MMELAQKVALEHEYITKRKNWIRDLEARNPMSFIDWSSSSRTPSPVPFPRSSPSRTTPPVPLSPGLCRRTPPPPPLHPGIIDNAPLVASISSSVRSAVTHTKEGGKLRKKFRRVSTPFSSSFFFCSLFLLSTLEVYFHNSWVFFVLQFAFLVMTFLTNGCFFLCSIFILSNIP